MIGGFDCKRASDVGKELAKETRDRAAYVVLSQVDLSFALRDAYQRGWEEAVRAKEAQEERG